MVSMCHSNHFSANVFYWQKSFNWKGMAMPFARYGLVTTKLSNVPIVLDTALYYAENTCFPIALIWKQKTAPKPHN
jgi:hypothetical protein